MSPRGPSTESPRARIAARWAPRATNVTWLPAFARAAPNDPPTPPAPITAIRVVSVPAVMLRSALDAGVGIGHSLTIAASAIANSASATAPQRAGDGFGRGTSDIIDVRFGSGTDILGSSADVRFTPESGHH